MNWSVSKRIAAAFGIMVTMLLVSLVVCVTSIQNLGANTEKKIRDFSESASTTATAMQGNIYKTLADLSGWMNSGDENYKQTRLETVDKLKTEASRLKNQLNPQWQDSELIALTKEVEEILPELAQWQLQTEEIANSVQETPATQILVEEAMPLTSVLLDAAIKLLWKKLT